MSLRDLFTKDDIVVIDSEKRPTLSGRKGEVVRIKNGQVGVLINDRVIYLNPEELDPQDFTMI